MQAPSSPYFSSILVTFFLALLTAASNVIKMSALGAAEVGLAAGKKLAAR